MSTTYERAPQHVNEAAERIIDLYHPDLKKAGVTIDFLYARNEKGEPLKLHGVRALAICKLTPLKERAKGNADAEISIDAEIYEGMDDDQRDALLDHELTHLNLEKDDDGDTKTDDLNRPLLKIRKHDYEFGWFTEVARRHGRSSPEVVQANLIFSNDGQTYFPSLLREAELVSGETVN